MNQNQVLTLVRSLIKILGTFLATKGATDVAGFLNNETVIGFILLVAGLIWSHLQSTNSAVINKAEKIIVADQVAAVAAVESSTTISPPTKPQN